MSPSASSCARSSASSEGPRTVELGRLIVEYLDAIMTPWFYGATLLLSGARVRDFLRARGAHMRDAADGERTLSRLPLQNVADRVGAIDAILFDEIARCRGAAARGARRAPGHPGAARRRPLRRRQAARRRRAARSPDDAAGRRPRDHRHVAGVGARLRAAEPGHARAHARRGRARLRRHVRSVEGQAALVYRRRRQRVDAPLSHRHRGHAHLEAPAHLRRLRHPRRHAHVAVHLPHATRRAPLARAREAPVPSASSTARPRSTSSSPSAPASGAASARSSPSTRCAWCWPASCPRSTSRYSRASPSSRSSAASPSRRRTACRSAFSDAARTPRRAARRRPPRRAWTTRRNDRAEGHEDERRDRLAPQHQLRPREQPVRQREGERQVGQRRAEHQPQRARRLGAEAELALDVGRRGGEAERALEAPHERACPLGVGPSPATNELPRAGEEHLVAGRRHLRRLRHRHLDARRGRTPRASSRPSGCCASSTRA